jgi:histidine triad (HIT) family protein
MQDSIFTRIIKGEIPCHKVYEDNLTIAFLDIHPKTPGHTLVVPKNQVEFAWDLPDEDYAALMATVKKVALRIREVMQAKYVGEQIVGIDLPHAHVHVFAFNNMDEYRLAPDMSADPDNEALEAIAQKLSFS